MLHEAEVELWEDVAYYEEKSPGLGLDLMAEIRQTVLTIRSSPERWHVRADGTRRCLAQGFPYMVVYTYTKHHVWMIAIAHCKRKPGCWDDRVRTAEPPQGIGEH